MSQTSRSRPPGPRHSTTTTMVASSCSSPSWWARMACIRRRIVSGAGMVGADVRETISTRRSTPKNSPSPERASITPSVKKGSGRRVPASPLSCLLSSGSKVEWSLSNPASSRSTGSAKEVGARARQTGDDCQREAKPARPGLRPPASARKCPPPCCVLPPPRVSSRSRALTNGGRNEPTCCVCGMDSRNWALLARFPPGLRARRP